MKEEDFEFNSVEPGVWKFENEGDSIFGVLINAESKDESNDLSAKYFIETETGMMMFWGSAVLDDRMKLVKIGKPVRITYLGTKKNAKGRDLKVFSVETGRKKSQTTTQAPAPSTPTETVE
jgi:hypothetical protein